jgi:hypothetical protein
MISDGDTHYALKRFTKDTTVLCSEMSAIGFAL